MINFNSQSQNVDTSNDEANSDGEDVLETEHNAPSRSSLDVNNGNVIISNVNYSLLCSFNEFPATIT